MEPRLDALHRGEHLPEFAEAGCLFIITAVESLSDKVLEILDKQHTRADVEAALGVCRDAGIPLRPTWVAFTPWTTLEDYCEVLNFIDAKGNVRVVPPSKMYGRLTATARHLAARVVRSRPSPPRQA